MSAPLTMTLKIEGETALDRLKALFPELAQRLPELAERLLGAMDAGEELFTFQSDGRAAPGAGELVIRLEPTDRLFGLMAACGAGDADLAAVKECFRHDDSPSVGGTTTVEQVGEGL